MRPDLGLSTASTALDEKRPRSDVLTVHAVTYRTENVRRMGYVQTEGVPYTENGWALEPLTTVRRLRYCSIPVVRYLVGREGQTMEAKTFAAEYEKLVCIVCGLVARHEGRLAQAVPESREFCRRSLRALISSVYRRSWNGE